jgi:hypothetical protein
LKTRDLGANWPCTIILNLSLIMQILFQTHLAGWLNASCMGFIALVAGGPLVCCLAQEPRLTIERTQVDDGYITEVVEGWGGGFVVSGEYWAAGSNRDWGSIPYITILDAAGTGVKRLNPPSISVSSKPLYLHWRVVAALADGSYIVDDDWLGRFHLGADGTPIHPNYPLPRGPIAVQSNGAVLFGRSPSDMSNSSALERWGSDVGPPQSGGDAFAYNVYRAWPVDYLNCAQIAIAKDGRIWAWLGLGDALQSPARLFRFLPSGQADPSFQPAQPIESTIDPFFNVSTTWLGPLTSGGLMVMQTSEQGFPVVRRLRPDGTIDPAFGWPFKDHVLTYPLLALSDGSLLVNRGYDGDLKHFIGVLKITPTGALDPAWLSQLPPLSGLANDEDHKAFQQSDGRTVHVRDFSTGQRGPFYRLFRLNSDGSLDTPFEASVSSPDPVPGVRLRVSGLVPGQFYSLEERSGLESTEISSEYRIFSQSNQREPIELLERLPGPDVRKLFWSVRRTTQP